MIFVESLTAEVRTDHVQKELNTFFERQSQTPDPIVGLTLTLVDIDPHSYALEMSAVFKTAHLYIEKPVSLLDAQARFDCLDLALMMAEEGVAEMVVEETNIILSRRGSSRTYHMVFPHTDIVFESHHWKTSTLGESQSKDIEIKSKINGDVRRSLGIVIHPQAQSAHQKTQQLACQAQALIALADTRTYGQTSVKIKASDT